MTTTEQRTRYQMIKMDPPWPETGGGGRGAQNHYPVIKKKETILEVIMDSGVFLPHDNCHLMIWYTNNYLLWAVWLMERMGFVYKTQVTWPKDSRGTGYYFAGQTEHCMFGVRGTLAPRIKAATTTLLTVADDPSAYAGGHSSKPHEIFDAAEKVGHGPRLEMFSREPRAGWDVWGRDDGLVPFINKDVQDVADSADEHPHQLGVGCVLRTTSSGLTEVVRVA